MKFCLALIVIPNITLRSLKFELRLLFCCLPSAARRCSSIGVMGGGGGRGRLLLSLIPGSRAYDCWGRVVPGRESQR